jgi:hypothetical protein
VKKDSKGAIRLITKFLLNALLGRFGMILDKKQTDLIQGYDNYRDIISSHKVYDEVRIGEELFLLSYEGNVSSVVCEQHGRDYIKVLNKNKTRIKKEEQNTFRNVSVGVSAAVTSYSSVFMSKIKNHILSRGGKIYYTDTDSIVTDIKLPDELIGEDLGQFKQDPIILRGYFISSKLYGLVI